MSRIAGIIHPSAFQITDLIGTINTTFDSRLSFQYFRHKNLEMGAWQSPMATNDRKNIWALLDGQIHNASELRDELHKKLGFKFSTSSHEEVLVHAYDAWKDDFLKKLKGPFALAIFDEEKEILLLALDRLGQNPLYWTSQGNYWLFSTQIKALLATGIVPQTPAIESLASYLYFGFVPQDLSSIHGVNKLLPGHYLKVDLNRQSMIDQYWSFSQHLDSKEPISSEEATHQLGKLIDQSICQTLPKEGVVGSFLKGNLGSSSMTWFLSHHTTRERIKSYSAAFEEPQPIELETTKDISSKLSVSHISKRITPEEVFQELPAIIWHLDEPIADPYIMQTWHLAKLASKEASTVYADVGWEEMFGGSQRYFKEEGEHFHPPLAFFLAQLPVPVREMCLLPLLGCFSNKYKYRVLRNVDINREQVNYLMGSALFKGRSRKKVSPLLNKAFNPEIFTQRFHRLTALPGSINPSLYYDAKTKLPDSSLYQYERLMSAHNIKLITPFLDHHLVEFLARLPEEIKFPDRKPAGLLHTLMEHLCHGCPEFPEREGSFLDTWRYNPTFRELFALLQNGCLEDEGLISKKWIKQQLSYPYLIPRTFRQLWAILVLEVWFRLFINRPIDGTPPTCTLHDLLSE